jgi:hypothetical protein
MTAFALHLPDRQGFWRWTLAAAFVAAAHVALIGSIALWYSRQGREPTMIPAIAVSLAPIEASSPEAQNQDPHAPQRRRHTLCTLLCCEYDPRADRREMTKPDARLDRRAQGHQR